MFTFLRIFCHKSSSLKQNKNNGQSVLNDCEEAKSNNKENYEKIYMGSSIDSLQSCDLNYYSASSDPHNNPLAIPSDGSTLNRQQFTLAVKNDGNCGCNPDVNSSPNFYNSYYEYASTNSATPSNNTDTTNSPSCTTTTTSRSNITTPDHESSIPGCKELDGEKDFKLSKIYTPRKYLPAPMPRAEISIWGILKQCIGKDLSKITMPIVLNEPLSFLQRLAEYMEYSYLLDKANSLDNPVERMEMVAAFAVSGCATNWDRLGKPFNPLLGETYELDMPERGFRMVCEQTSHHPPISAFHAQSCNYIFHGSIQPKSKFWGKALDVQPVGIITLQLPNHNDVYTWSNPNCSIHNIIIGKLWIEHSGPLEIINHTNNYRCSLNFRPAGMFGKELNRVDGFIFDHKDVKVRALYGHWNLALYSTLPKIYDEYLSKNVNDKMSRRRSSSMLADQKNSKNLNNGQGKHDDATNLVDSMEGLSVSTDQLKYANYVLNLPKSQLLWKHSPKPSNSPQIIQNTMLFPIRGWAKLHVNKLQIYNFSLFSMMLNEPPPSDAILPPTDSRYRPDLREYEMGRIEIASKLKTALEEKQRTLAKLAKSNKSIRSDPMWFQVIKNPYVKGEDDWTFREEYWNRNYSACPKIFDLTTSVSPQ